mgnify:CR=1 FL=1
MQQASRIADYTAFFLVGEMVEYGPTKDVFGMPKDKRTEIILLVDLDRRKERCQEVNLIKNLIRCMLI